MPAQPSLPIIPYDGTPRTVIRQGGDSASLPLYFVGKSGVASFTAWCSSLSCRPAYERPPFARPFFLEPPVPLRPAPRPHPPPHPLAMPEPPHPVETAATASVTSENSTAAKPAYQPAASSGGLTKFLRRPPFMRPGRTGSGSDACFGGSRCTFFLHCWMAGGSLGSSCGPLLSCCITPSDAVIKPRFYGPIKNDLAFGRSLSSETMLTDVDSVRKDAPTAEKSFAKR